MGQISIVSIFTLKFSVEYWHYGILEYISSGSLVRVSVDMPAARSTEHTARDFYLSNLV